MVRWHSTHASASRSAFRMPTYEYRCKSCGHELEVQQSFTDAALTECPECHGQLRKVFGNVAVTFKGSGFYKNDSRSTSSTTTKPSESSSSSSDSSSSSMGSSTESKKSSDTGSSGPLPCAVTRSDGIPRPTR